MGTGVLLLLIAFALAKKPEPTPDLPDLDDGDARNGREPDYQPGPVVIPAEPEDDSEWLAAVDSLFADVPTPGRFYRIQAGDTMSALAGEALGGANTGSNRLALIKCLTRVPWNDALYVSDRHPGGWGTLYDVDGRNLSAAFLPRHASAVQELAQRREPPRTINMVGDYLGFGPTGYFGSLWFPSFTANQNAVVCSPGDPPAWLLNALAKQAGLVEGG